MFFLNEKMPYFVLLSLIYFICSFAGSDFIETFAYIDSNRWIAEEGKLHCTHDGQEACALTRASNFDHIEMFGDADQDLKYGDHVTYLEMRNDCNSDAECCKKDSRKCTDMTTARLLSVQTFSYGKFELLARAAPERKVFFKKLIFLNHIDLKLRWLT